MENQPSTSSGITIFEGKQNNPKFDHSKQTYQLFNSFKYVGTPKRPLKTLTEIRAEALTTNNIEREDQPSQEQIKFGKKYINMTAAEVEKYLEGQRELMQNKRNEMTAAEVEQYLERQRELLQNIRKTMS